MKHDQQLPVSLWDLLPIRFYRNMGEVENINTFLAYFVCVLFCTTANRYKAMVLPVCSPQYGSGKTLGAKSDGRTPTYVFPTALKAVMRRARFPDDVKDW